MIEAEINFVKQENMKDKSHTDCRAGFLTCIVRLPGVLVPRGSEWKAWNSFENGARPTIFLAGPTEAEENNSQVRQDT